MIKRLLWLIVDIVVCFFAFFFFCGTFIYIEGILYRACFPGSTSIPKSLESLIVFATLALSVFCTVKLHKFMKRKREESTHAIKKHRSKSAAYCEEKCRKILEGKIPHSKNAQTELAESIITNIDICTELMNDATHASNFVHWFDEIILGYKALSKLTKAKHAESPYFELHNLENEFQWHLCDAIARAKDHTISEIKGKYKNSKEFQTKAAKAFEDDMRTIQHRFSADTSEFAAAAVKEVNSLVSARTAPHTQDDFIKYGGIDAELLTIDLMEGHEFEYWCASLLKKIGFQKADVTQASGDDGVDIIAEKDGIRYAVQCKCYSSDLGNKPVQEVHTGKAVYQCHVGAVMTNRHFTAGGKRAADATGTLLWDRDWITKALEHIKE